MRNFIIILGWLLASAPLAAQELIPEPFTDRSVGIELARPLLDGDDGLDALSWAAHIWTRFPVGGVHLLFDLPVARMHNDIFESSALGNLMVGVELMRGRATFCGTVHLPTAPNNEFFASSGGALSESQNAHAGFPDVTTFSFGGILRDRGSAGVGFDLMGGAVIMDIDDADTELLLDYGAQFVYRPRAVGMTIGLQGLMGVTGEGGFSDRTTHELRARLDCTAGRIRPAIGFSYPLDDYLREALDGVVRLGLQVGI